MTNPDNNSITGELALNILQQIPTPVMAVNRKMELIFMNDASLKFLGAKHPRYPGGGGGRHGGCQRIRIADPDPIPAVGGITV